MTAFRLTTTMRYVLLLAQDGKSLYTGVAGRAAHGGRVSAISALRKRGLLNSDLITQAGRAALDPQRTE